MEHMSQLLEQSDAACARLLRLVVRAKAMVGKVKNPSEAWIQLLGLPNSELPELYRAIGAFVTLIRQARDEVAAITDSDPDLWLASFDELSARVTLISLHDSNSWENVFGPALHNATVRGLHLAAARVAERGPKRLSKETLAELRSIIESLDDALAECSPDLAEVLARCINLLRVAVNHYEVFGSEGIERAVQEAFGALFTSTSAYAHASSTPVRRVFEAIVKFNNFITFARNVRALCAGGAATFSMLLSAPSGDTRETGVGNGGLIVTETTTSNTIAGDE